MSKLQELRNITKVSMSECQKALKESDGNIDQAIEILRKRGLQAAVKKQGRVTNNGLVGVKSNSEGTVCITLACETDFVSKGAKFAEILGNIMDYALEVKLESKDDFIAANENKAENMVAEAIQVVGENVKIDSYLFVPSSKSNVASYVHGPSEHNKNMGQSVTTVMYSGPQSNELKKIAMHITAAKPEFLDIASIDNEYIEKEKSLIKDTMDLSKPADIIEKIIDGKMNKIYQQIALMEQKFIMDDSVKISEYLKSVDDDIKILEFCINKIG